MLSKMNNLPESQEMASGEGNGVRRKRYQDSESNQRRIERMEKSSLPLKRFFNTSGMLYKEQKLKERLPQMTEEEQYEVLASDGMLVKRPILVTQDTVLTGFKEKEWEELL